jgi:hypothetical protein
MVCRETAETVGIRGGDDDYEDLVGFKRHFAEFDCSVMGFG